MATASNRNHGSATLAAGALLLVGLLTPQVAPAQAEVALKRPKIGVAFEGGGALGLGHVGVLEWMEKNHIPVDYVAGTSMGGLVGGLYATGNSPAEIRAIMRDIDWDEVLRGQTSFEDLSYRRKEDKRAYPNYIELGLRKKKIAFPGGLNSGQQVRFILDRAALPYSYLKSFDELPIPFRCVATDMGTGTAHVFKDGSLSEALRATMSLPAIFTPVVTKEGKVYTDGGLMNNLPVDVVKAMGADIVIAIYLDTAPFDPKNADSLFSILGRTVGVMIAANERHNMEAADILVTVDLAGYTAEDYNSGDKIADKGYEGAEKKATLLSRLAVDGPTWQQYIAQRTGRRIQTVPTPEFVAVQGTSPQMAKNIEGVLANNIGKQVDPKQLEGDLARISGMGRFSSLNYQMIRRDNKDGLLIDSEEKSYAPPTLQPGIVVDGSQYNSIRFSVGARITFMDLGGFRSEWRTDFVLGSVYGINSEYYRPFTPDSRWFYAPRIFSSVSPVDLYSDSKRLAEYGLGQSGGAFDVGYEFNHTSELRAGYSMGYQSANLRIGSPGLPTGSGQLSSSSIRYNLYAVDNPVIPRTGTYLTSSFQYIDHAPNVAGGFYAAQLNGVAFKKISKPASVFFGADGGTTFGHQGGIPQYFLGGGLRLGAYGRNEILTNQYYLFRIGYIRELGTVSPLFGEKIYALGFYEVAKTYGGVSPSRLPTDVNAGLVVNTLFGPVFIAGAYGDTGHRKIYFQLGRIF